MSSSNPGVVDRNPTDRTVEGDKRKLFILAEDRINPYQGSRGRAAQVAAFLMGSIAHIGVALQHGINRMAPGKTGQGTFHTMDQCNVGDTPHRIGVGGRRLRPVLLGTDNVGGVDVLGGVEADRLVHARAEQQDCADEQWNGGECNWMAAKTHCLRTCSRSGWEAPLQYVMVRQDELLIP